MLGVLMCMSLSGGLSGCAGEHMSMRKRVKKQEMLRDAVQAYWHSLRWGYYDRAVPFIEDPVARALLWEYLLEREGKATINEAMVYRLDWPEEDEPATVYIRYQLYLADEINVTSRKAVQTWYLSNGQWYLDLTPEELALLSPVDEDAESEGETEKKP